jgi:hypothetical protein
MKSENPIDIIASAHDVLELLPADPTEAAATLSMVEQALAHPDRKERRIFPYSTRLADSVRDCAIDLNFAVSSSPSANSIARRHAAMTFNSSLAT